jgi:hypothetical protein
MAALIPRDKRSSDQFCFYPNKLLHNLNQSIVDVLRRHWIHAVIEALSSTGKVTHVFNSQANGNSTLTPRGYTAAQDGYTASK